MSRAERAKNPAGRYPPDTPRKPANQGETRSGWLVRPESANLYYINRHCRYFSPEVERR
jgi:hypothetical protein